MIYFCFLDDPTAKTSRMEVLRATEDDAAVAEARDLPGPSGIEGHVFNGDQFVRTITTEPRYATLKASPRQRKPAAPMDRVSAASPPASPF